MQVSCIQACGLARGSDPKAELYLSCFPKTAPHFHLKLLTPASAYLPKCMLLPEMPYVLSPHENVLSPACMATTLAQHFIILHQNYFSEPALSASILFLVLLVHKAQKNLPPLSPITPPYRTPLPTRQVSSLSLPETHSFSSAWSLEYLFSSLAEYTDLPPALGCELKCLLLHQVFLEYQQPPRLSPLSD